MREWGTFRQAREKSAKRVSCEYYNCVHMKLKGTEHPLNRPAENGKRRYLATGFCPSLVKGCSLGMINP